MFFESRLQPDLKAGRPEVESSVFIKRTHLENRTNVNVGGVKGGF
jgi:hypothetical protein